MKLNPGFELRNICGENVIIAHGVENIDFMKIVTLNESAADIWNALSGQAFTLDDAVRVFTDAYEVDADTARRDCEQLLADWRELGFLDEQEKE